MRTDTTSQAIPREGRAFRTTLTRLATIATLAALAILFAGCSPAIVVTVSADGAGSASFRAEASESAEAIVRRFTGAQAQIFDKDEIVASVTKAGFAIDSLEFPGRAGIALACSVPAVDGILSRAVTVSKVNRKLSFTLSRESVAAALTLMPASTGDYLDLLMAPVFTGEELKKDEYESIIAAAYGKTLAAELKKSTITITVRCPQAARTAKINPTGIAATSGNGALFTIPLSALLAMEAPILASVEW